jgi:hypothetical protein
MIVTRIRYSNPEVERKDYVPHRQKSERVKKALPAEGHLCLMEQPIFALLLRKLFLLV